MQKGDANAAAQAETNPYSNNVEMGIEEVDESGTGTGTGGGVENRMRDAHFLVQQGAAEGRALHKNANNKRSGFDPSARAEVLGTTGLRLLQHILRSKELLAGCGVVLEE